MFKTAREANEKRIKQQVTSLTEQIQDLQRRKADSKDPVEVAEFNRQIGVIQDEDIKPLRTELKSIEKNLG